MTTGDTLDTSTAVLVVAGLCVSAVGAAAVYALRRTVDADAQAQAQQAQQAQTRAQTRTKTRGDTHDMRSRSGGGGDGVREARGVSEMRRRRRGGKSKDKDEGEDEGEVEDAARGEGRDKGENEGGDQGKGEGKGKGRVKRGSEGLGAATTVSIPGSFDGVGSDVGPPQGSSPDTGTASNQGTTVKPQKKKVKKVKKQKQKQESAKDWGKDEDREREDQDAGSETGKEAKVGQHLGDSTDASVSLSLSVSGDAPSGFSRGMGKGSLLTPPSQPHALHREIRPSLSLDTDSSWTHVDRHRPKTSKSADGLARRTGDAVDVTSSDLASTASDSPVAERMDGITTDMRGARADLVQRTLAEKLVPRPSRSGVEDMLEQPDVPTLARVMRVQPPADEIPVPGFSWEDYGEVVEESVLVQDTDEEDEGEWGVVKSRNRTRPLQTMGTSASTLASASTSHTPAASETMTKKQRQNARKRELAKSVKAEAEVTRVQGLAKHKRELERLRIIEQSRQGGGGKQPSGGMQAVVDDRGKLVWE